MSVRVVRPPHPAVATDHAGARVILVRPRAGVWWLERGRFRRYKVLIDGEVRGEIRHDEELAVDVSPGQHVAQVRIAWTGSPPLAFEVAAGQTIRLWVGPGTEGTLQQQAMSHDGFLTLYVEHPIASPHERLGVVRRIVYAWITR
jgi:hypothetical protein